MNNFSPFIIPNMVFQRLVSYNKKLLQTPLTYQQIIISTYIFNKNYFQKIKRELISATYDIISPEKGEDGMSQQLYTYMIQVKIQEHTTCRKKIS